MEDDATIAAAVHCYNFGSFRKNENFFGKSVERVIIIINDVLIQMFILLNEKRSCDNFGQYCEIFCFCLGNENSEMKTLVVKK